MKPVNLLPKQYRAAEASGARNGSAYLVVGVLGLLLALALPWTLTANKTNSAKSEVASVKAEIAVLEQKISGQSAFAAFRTVKETRLSSVSTLARGRFDWERVMRELALLLPAKSWLLDVTATTTPEAAAPTVAGAAPAPAAGSLSPQIKLIGCAVRQREVADMLVRLRKMHRASDVKLAESVQKVAVGAVSDGAPSGDGCTPGRFQFDVTVTFDSVAPVESPRHAVPASLGGGS